MQGKNITGNLNIISNTQIMYITHNINASVVSVILRKLPGPYIFQNPALY